MKALLIKLSNQINNHFTKIAVVAGNGYDSMYNFTDPEIMRGITYYRIKLYETRAAIRIAN